MKQLLLCASVLASVLAAAQNAPPLQSQFPLRWKAKIGGTTFKTNFLLKDGLLLVGSNGSHYRDWRLDKDNGVCIVNAANGKIEQRFASEGYGDMDVNGVAFVNGKIFFGNDNEEFLCYNAVGEQLWRVPVSGDVESEPVTLDVNCDGSAEMIFGTESGEVLALDSKNGNVVWSFKIKDFSGWDKTESRLLFKVGAFFSNGSGFVSKPAVADLTGDAVQDLIFNCRDGYTYALDGENGKMLWKFNHGDIYFLANSPLVVEEGQQKRIYILQNRMDEKNRERMHMVCLNGRGALQKTYPASWHYSVNFVPVHRGNQLLSVYNDTLVALNLETGALKKTGLPADAASAKEDYYWYSHYVTARPLFFDFLGKDTEQLLLVDEAGLARLLDGSTYKQLKYFSLPSGTETTPLIADVDDDGKMEMLVSCYDGYLYCYDLKTSAKKPLAVIQ